MPQTTPVAAPPERFNFARHLLALNAQRPEKTALIDDVGSLSYGQLADQVRRFSSALQALGLKREERVLLLMHDSTDWVVSFLGALHAGVVPVAVNTLLTAKDYAYMLSNSRAQAVFVSAALLPTLQSALAESPNEVRQLIVSRASATLPDASPYSAHDLSALLAAHTPGEGADTHADEPAFWLYSSGSTGSPKGTVHTQASLYWTAELYGRAVLGLTAQDVTFSAAKLFFA